MFVARWGELLQPGSYDLRYVESFLYSLHNRAERLRQTQMKSAISSPQAALTKIIEMRKCDSPHTVQTDLPIELLHSVK